MTITKTLLKTFKRDKQFLIEGLDQRIKDILTEKWEIKEAPITAESANRLQLLQREIESNRRQIQTTLTEIAVYNELINL